MVRKTTAVEIDKKEVKKASPQTSHTTENADDMGINFEKLLSDAWEGAKENGHLLIGVVCLLWGLIILREFLVGMILVTSGILFISWFFKK
jgi:hypothetical protein